MSFESEFRALLTGSAAVTTLVPAARINWSEHPQGGGIPYIVLHLIGNDEGSHLTGSTGLWTGRVQVDCWAETPASAIAIGNATHTLLHATAPGGFQLIRNAGTRGPQRDSGTNEPRRLFRRSLDFVTHWRA